jgi:CRP-like cAMP-binding protein
MSELLLSACQKILRPVRISRNRAADLADFWSVAPAIEVLAGTVLLREGDPGDSLLFVIHGSVKVTVQSPEGKPIDVATLASPILLGATGVMDGGKRTSTCTVDQVATVLRMRRPQFLRAARQATPGAEVLRQLLLITMHQQLIGATDRLRAVLETTP